MRDLLERITWNETPLAYIIRTYAVETVPNE